MHCLAVEPGARLVAAARHGAVDIRSLGAGALLKRIIGLDGDVNAVAFSGDGRKLFAAGGIDGAQGNLWSWDLRDWKQAAATGHTDAISCLAASPNGQYIATGSYDHKIVLWEAKTLAIVRELDEHAGPVTAVAFRADGAYLASCSLDHTVRLWDIKSGKCVDARVESDQPMNALVWSPDGLRLAAGGEDRRLRVWSVAAGNIDKPLALESSLVSTRSAIVRLDWSTDNKTISSSTADGAVVQFSATDLKPLKTLPGGGEIAYGLASAGQSLAIGRIDGKLSIIDSSTGVELKLPKLAIPNLETTSLERIHVARRLDLPAQINGAFEPGSVDRYAFDLKKGERITIDVDAYRIRSQARVRLTLQNDARAVLAVAGPTDSSPDPLLTLNAPADGRYTLTLADLTGSNSAASTYRLRVGGLGVVTGTLPIALPPNTTSRVLLVGPQLPADSFVTVKTAAPGELEIAPDPTRYVSRHPIKVLVNNRLDTVRQNGDEVMALAAPASVSARITSRREAHLYRFSATAGSRYVIETLAAQRGSPIDTRIQVMHVDGRPVQRLKLQAVLESGIAGRSIDSIATSAKLNHGHEMDLDQFLYMNGEVACLFERAQSQAADYVFYSRAGRRRCFFDTSAVSHSADEVAYIVEPHPIGQALSDNGFPIFTLNYENDDASDGDIGRDSRLTFQAPANGDYIIRVTDSRGLAGNDFVYQLLLRPAVPDFELTLDGYNPSLPAGSGRQFIARVRRIDGADGPVTINIAGLPDGFAATTPLVVESGQDYAFGVIYAAPTAAPVAFDAPARPIKVTASATIDGRTVNHVLGDVRCPFTASMAPISVSAEPVTITAGQSATITLRLNRPTDRPVTVELHNLPRGSVVAEGARLQFLPGSTQLQASMRCAKTLPAGDRLFHVSLKEYGNLTSAPIWLHVQK